MKNSLVFGIVCILAGCGSAQSGNPQPNAPAAPQWAPAERPQRPLVIIPAAPIQSSETPQPGNVAPKPRLVERTARRIDPTPIPRLPEPPAEKAPAYGLSLDLHIPLPEVPAGIQGPTPAEAVPGGEDQP